MQNLELEISSAEGGRYRVAVRSAAVGGTQSMLMQLPFDEQVLERKLEAAEFALMRSTATVRRLTPVDEQPVQELGRQLFEFLFPAEIREQLNAVRRQAAQEDGQMQVRLQIGPPELAVLPWEFMYDQSRDDYLCLSSSLVRYLNVLEPPRRLAVTPPLRILCMAASSGGRDNLNIDLEKRRLNQALSDLSRVGGVRLTWVDGQTWRDLDYALDQGGWHIFHFIGHSGFDRQRSEGFLGLADEDGEEYRLRASDLGQMLGGRPSLRLVVLNSCEGGRGAASDVFSSAAAVLIRRGIPAVVAMQYDISDGAAIDFARGLYTALARRHPVDHAVTRARREIKLTSRRQDTLEWITPVLYLRSPEAQLFDLAAPPRAEDQPADTEYVAPNPPGDGSTNERIQQIWPASGVPGVAAPPPRESRVSTGSELALMQHDGSVGTVAFSPDGTRLASSSADNTARLWEVASGRELARMEHDGEVWIAAFSPDGTRLASSSADNTARLWEVASGRELARMEHGDWVKTVAFSPDGTYIATGSADETARVWEVFTGQLLSRMHHHGWIWTVAFSPDGIQLATSSHGDNTARLWEVASGRELARMEHGDWVKAVAFSPDGALLATACADNTARLWQTASGRELARMNHDGPVLGVEFSPDGALLATACADNTARLWQTASGRELARMNHGGQVWALTYSWDGTRLATGSHDDNTARLWHGASGRELARMEHDGPVLAVEFSPDGTQLATASSDKTVRLWAA